MSQNPDHFSDLTFMEPSEIVNLVFQKTRFAIREDDPLVAMIYLNNACLAHMASWVESRFEKAHSDQQEKIRIAYQRMAAMAEKSVRTQRAREVASPAVTSEQMAVTPEQQARLAAQQEAQARRTAKAVYSLPFEPGGEQLRELALMLHTHKEVEVFFKKLMDQALQRHQADVTNLLLEERRRNDKTLLKNILAGAFVTSLLTTSLVYLLKLI